MKFQSVQGGGLGAVEQDERAVLFVGQKPLVVRRASFDKVEQGQVVVGILHGLVEATQRQPADAALIELQKFAVYFALLIFVQHKAFALMNGQGH